MPLAREVHLAPDDEPVGVPVVGSSTDGHQGTDIATVAARPRYRPPMSASRRHLPRPRPRQESPRGAVTTESQSDFAELHFGLVPVAVESAS